MSTQSDIVISVVANVIYGVLSFAVRFFPQSLKNHQRWNRGVLMLLAFLWAAMNTTAYLYFPETTPWTFAVSSVIFGVWIWRQFDQYWSTGIIGIDKTVEAGMDYETSLRRCVSQLEFMGIGAHKLTTSSEFEAAVKRCSNPTKPIRLLLSHPENNLLENAAHQEGRQSLEYQNNVKASLRTIAHLRCDRRYNIEVRLYRRDAKSKPIIQYFRMMFINDELCLFSYNVFGEGSGKKQPQMHVRRDASKRDVDSFYHAFRCHFEELWRTAIECDLQEFLEKEPGTN